MFASMVTGLGLFLALPALAEEKVGSGKIPGRLATQVVEITGQLHHEKGVLASYPGIPFDYWELLADGKMYYLDLRAKELRGQAEKLNDRTVEVIGTLAPSSPTIRVTGFKYALVEIKGKLCKTLRIPEHWYHPDLFERSAPRERAFAPRNPHVPDDRFPMPNLGPIDRWTITVAGQTYELTFDSKDLRKLAEKLNGKVVVVTGTPRNYHIHVTGMKAEESESAREKATTEVYGQVKRLKINGPLGDSYECWGLTINGETYELDFGGLKDLAEMTKNLGGTVVTVSGVLEVIPPRESKIPLSNGPRHTFIRYPGGRMIIHVTSLTVAKAP